MEIKSGMPATGGVGGFSPYFYQNVVFIIAAWFWCVFQNDARILLKLLLRCCFVDFSFLNCLHLFTKMLLHVIFIICMQIAVVDIYFIMFNYFQGENKYQ